MLFGINALYGQTLDTVRIGVPGAGTGERLDSGFRKVNLTIKQVNTNTTSKVAIADSASYGAGHYASYGDMVTGLATKPTFAEVRVIVHDSIDGIEGGTTDTVHLSDRINLKVDIADSATYGAGHYFSYSAGVNGLALKLAKTDTVTLSNRINLKLDKADTASATAIIPLLVDVFPITFPYGRGIIGDTSTFVNNIVLGPIYNTYGDTLVPSTLRCFMTHGAVTANTDTLKVQVSWHATFMSGSATVLNTTALSIGRPNALTTGTVDASFNNVRIPPNNAIWVTLTGVVAGYIPCKVSVILGVYRKK